MRKFVLPLLFVFCCLFLLFSVAQARSQNSTTQKPQFTQQKRELSNSFPERISGHQSQNSHIVVHPDTLDFDTTMTGYSVIRELHIRNAGTTDLMVSDIQSTDYVFTVDTTHFSLPPADSLVLPVTFLPFIMGDYNGELLIISNDPAPQRDTVRVFMRGSGYSPPIIHPPLYPLSIEETVPEGDTLTVDLFITNNSPVTLRWVAEIDYFLKRTGQSLSPGDTLFTTDVSAVTPGQATVIRGVAFDGEHIWIAGVDSGSGAYLYKFSQDWQFLNRYPQPVTFPFGFRELTFGVTSLYGAIGNFLVEIDTLTGLATGNIITTPVSDIWAAAADPATGNFYLSDAGQTISVVSSSGVLLNQFPYTGPLIHGLALDRWSPGYGYLWGWVADGPPEGPNCTALQWDINTGQLTGLSFVGYDNNGDPSANDQPAGADIGIVNNHLTFLGLQSSNHFPGDGHDFVVGYSLGITPLNWLTIAPDSGHILPWDQEVVEVKIVGIMESPQDTLHTALIEVFTNDPVFSHRTVPVTAHVTPMVGMDEIPSAHPETFLLKQNYPNPFNPYTNVEFGIGNAEWVTLTVYDILGRKVATLINQKLSPGNYKLRWDSRDDAGRKAGSGVYIYRLKAENFKESRKMVLMR